jgi:threonine synthase
VAAFAGMLKFRRQGLIPSGSKNVVLLTGSGLKDLRAVQSSIHIPEPIEPDVASAERVINAHLLIFKKS